MPLTSLLSNIVDSKGYARGLSYRLLRGKKSGTDLQSLHFGLPQVGTEWPKTVE